VTGLDDSLFRLGMARTLVQKAQAAAARGEWREAALFARGSVEAAAKAVVACFTGVPRSHEPAALLRDAAAQPGFPAALRADAGRLLPVWAGYGMAEHVLLSYGDERNRIDPWSLVGEARAREAVAVAEEALSFAERCRRAVFANP
jgi:HEPN domain-containing protein